MIFREEEGVVEDMLRVIEEVGFGAAEKIVERVVRRGVKIARVIAAMPMSKARVLKLVVDGGGCMVLESED